MFSGNIRTTFRTTICKSKRYMNIFFPCAVAGWNMEIFKYNDVPSVGILRKDIISLIRTECKVISTFSIKNKFKSFKKSQIVP